MGSQVLPQVLVLSRHFGNPTENVMYVGTLCLVAPNTILDNRRPAQRVFVVLLSFPTHKHIWDSGFHTKKGNVFCRGTCVWETQFKIGL